MERRDHGAGEQLPEGHVVLGAHRSTATDRRAAQRVVLARAVGGDRARCTSRDAAEATAPLTQRGVKGAHRWASGVAACSERGSLSKEKSGGTGRALCTGMAHPSLPRPLAPALFALALLVAHGAHAQGGEAQEAETTAVTETENVTMSPAEPATGSASALEPEPASQRDDRDAVMEHIRFEGTIGFLGGWARYADLGLSSSPALPPTAFDAGAVAGSPIAGLRYDLRLVVAVVRMTAGADFAWSMFRAAGTTRMIDTASGAQRLTDRGVFLWALRFGLGLEAHVLPGLRLFADVTGSVRFLEVQVALDAQAATASAVSFAPGLRLGTRIAIVDAFFAQLSVDASPLGPWVTGELSVGGAFE